MALMAAKIASNPIVTHRTAINGTNGRVEPLNLGSKCALTGKSRSFSEPFACPTAQIRSRQGYSVLCWSRRPHETETETKDNSSSKTGDAKSKQLMVRGGNIDSSQGLAEAWRFIYNDAKFVNERARNDIFLLSRGIMRLDARARQDVAILGTEFLKLDARAREDTGKIDKNMKKKAERLHQITTILKNKAQSKIKTAADRHWNDGALEADLRLADIRAKQRAMEDALMALEFVKNIHDLMVSKMYTFPLGSVEDAISSDDVMGRVMLEKNGKNLDFFPGEVSTDRISAIQEAYWSMASALSEADGIDYTDPEELELLIMTLIDLDAMDGKSSVSLLAECSSSPDDNTSKESFGSFDPMVRNSSLNKLDNKKALANALATAPSMWTLGNAGMGALQRLSEDSNPAIASAASKAINELKNQWEIVEGDSWRFMVNQEPFTEIDQIDDENDDDDSV